MNRVSLSISSNKLDFKYLEDRLALEWNNFEVFYEHGRNYKIGYMFRNNLGKYQ